MMIVGRGRLTLTVAAGPSEKLYVEPRVFCTKAKAFGARNYRIRIDTGMKGWIRLDFRRLTSCAMKLRRSKFDIQNSFGDEKYTPQIDDQELPMH